MEKENVETVDQLYEFFTELANRAADKASEPDPARSYWVGYRDGIAFAKEMVLQVKSKGA